MFWQMENFPIFLKDVRLLGHDIEAMWFIMDLGKRLNRPDLIEKAKNITLTMLDYGWDKEFGGIYYFMDQRDVHPNNWNGIRNCGGFILKL